MTASNREPSITVTLGYEGGYTNDRADPGGPTNWGITIFDARKYWKSDATAADVRAMPKSVAIDIYRKRYWDALNCDDDPAGVDLVTFDYGVNSGIGRARPVRAKTKAADAVAWVKAICAERLNFLHHLRTWSVFGKGWGSRVVNVEARGVKMALQAQGHAPEVVKKTLEEHGTAAVKKAVKQAGGSVATGGASQLPQVPDVSHLNLSTKIGIGIAIAVAAVFVAWVVWHNFQRWRAYKAVAAEA